MRLVAPALLALALGCAAAPPAPGPVPAAAVTIAAEPVAPAEPEATAPSPAREMPPDGYVELEVGGVVSTPGGPAVMLVDAERRLAVPIFVGGTEALAIELRHNRKRFTRPLTHDLLDEIMAKTGAKLVKVQIDEIKDETFVGSIFIHHQGRMVEIDARPSDAIAMALGARAPIFVAVEVVNQAGMKREELVPDALPAPAQPQPI